MLSSWAAGSRAGRLELGGHAERERLPNCTSGARSMTISLGQSKGPQAMPNLLEDFVGEEGAENGLSLGSAGRAEAAALARVRDEKLGAALVAAHSGEAAIEDAAIEERVDRCGCSTASDPRHLASADGPG